MAKSIEQKMDALMARSRYDADASFAAFEIFSDLLMQFDDFKGKVYAALPLLPMEAGKLIDHLCSGTTALQRRELVEPGVFSRRRAREGEQQGETDGVPI